MKSFSSLIILGAITVFSASVSGCSGDRIEMHGVKGTAAAPVVDLGMTAEQAAAHIKQAADEAAQKEAIEEVLRRHGSQFEWGFFWDKLREAHVTERFSAANRARLYNLHKLSCREDWFKSFAMLVLESPDALNESSFLFGNENGCTASLGIHLAGDLLRILKKGMKNAASVEEKQKYARAIALFFARETRLGSYGIQAAEDLSRSLTIAEWNSALQTLASAGAGDELVGLLQSLNGSSYTRLADSFSRSAMQNTAVFDVTVRKIGLRWVLDAFELSSNENIEALTKNQKQNLLERMAAAFERESFEVVDPWESLARAYSVYGKIRAFERRIDGGIDGIFAVTWLDRVQEALERFFSKDKSLAKNVISGFSRESLDDIWLRLRFLGRNDARRSAFDQSPAVRTDRVLSRRLKAHLTERHDQRRAAIEDLCSELKTAGFAEKQVSTIQELSEPGCKSWVGASSIQATSVKMAFDSVLRTLGRALDIRAASLDGSILDLSATQTLPALALEETPSSYDSISFPVLIGFKIQSPDIFPEGSGVHYVLVHYVHETTRPGPESSAKPSQGFPGGDLNVTVENPESSFEPSAVSLGGAGQKAAPARLGGKGSSYSARLRDYDLWLKRWLANEPTLITKGETPILRRSPTVLDLRKLLANAERTREETPTGPRVRIRTFINPGFVELLGESTKAQLAKACGSTPPAECLEKNLGSKVADYLHASVSNRRAPEDDLVIMPIVQTNYLSESSFATLDGEAGPVMADGAQGEQGTVTLRGFSEE